MIDFKDINTLREYLNKEHQGSRIKFATKVFHVLNFTKDHPDSINCCGASWCNDGLHFICNATIIANFLNLRSNSINTNFRDHGFRIDHTNLNQIKHEFPHLVNIRNWKMRSNAMFSFKYNLNIEDVEKIPCTSTKPSFIETDKPISFSIPLSTISPNNFSQPASTPASFSCTPFQSNSPLISKPEMPKTNSDFILSYELPRQVHDFVCRSPLVASSTYLLYTRIDVANKEFVDKIFIRILNDWNKYFGKDEYAFLDKFCSIIKDQVSDPDDREQIVENALFLLHKSTALGPLKKYPFEEDPLEKGPLKNKPKIFFHEFMEFDLYYGFCESWVDSLIQISEKIQNPFQGMEDPPRNPFPQPYLPRFHSWFQPYFNKESALRLLSGDDFVKKNVWFVSPSESPMIFDLFYKYKKDISYTEISFNPMESEKRFTVNIKGSETTAPNLQTILYKILSLNSQYKLESSTISRLNYLQPDQIASIQFEGDKRNEFDPSILGRCVPLHLQKRQGIP